MLTRLRITTWHGLLGQARRHPWRSGGLIALGLMLLSGLFGWWMDRWEESWVNWLDNAFIVLGGLSLALGWALALVLRAQQQEAALTFRGAGAEVQDLSFRAGLILVSQPVLLEWHLRHIPHKRVELVWTEQKRAVAEKLLPLFPNIRCVHGPSRDAAESLSDAFDLNAVKAHCRMLLLELLASYPRGQVCVDVTGGTAVMSVGAFQVAEELGVTSLYLMGEHRPGDGPPAIRGEHVRERAEGRIVILSDHRTDAAPAETERGSQASQSSPAPAVSA